MCGSFQKIILFVNLCKQMVFNDLQFKKIFCLRESKYDDVYE